MLSLVNDKGWNESKLRRHFDWPNYKGKRKKCPRILISPKDSAQNWEWFKSEVKKRLKIKG